MEIIDFNPRIIQRRLSAEGEAGNTTKFGSSLALCPGEPLAKDPDNGETPGYTESLGDRKAGPGDKPDATSGPKCDELESRSRITTVAPSQVPAWIPVGAAIGCNLPYTSYEIPIPLDLNMDFCIDVMMGQDTIVFMFVCGDCFVLVFGRG